MSSDPQSRAGNRAGAVAIGRHLRPVEKGQFGAGMAQLVAIEQVISRDVVLVDRLLDQPHAQNLGVELDVSLGFGRNRGHVM